MAFQLRSAIRSRDMSALKKSIVEVDPNFDINALVNGCTLLGYAAYADFPEGVEFLLEKGADPNTQSFIMDLYHWKGTETPLHTASRKTGKHNLRIAQALISYGASPDKFDSFLVTPLRYAVHNRYHAMVVFLLAHGANPFWPKRDSVVRNVIRDYHKDDGVTFGVVWRWMVEHQSRFDQIDAEGNSTLHVAAKFGVHAVIAIVLDSCMCRGDILNQSNDNMMTPLALAISARNFPSVFLLLGHGGPPMTITTLKESDTTPFTMASPLFRAFKLTLDDGRYDEIRIGTVDYDAAITQKLHHQRFLRRLCHAIADAGFSLRREYWLDREFEEITLGPEGPVEFRDVSWSSISTEVFNEVKLTYESLRVRRRQPSSLKCVARLAVRAALMNGPCPRCRATRAGLEEPSCLVKLIEKLDLPNNLRKLITAVDC